MSCPKNIWGASGLFLKWGSMSTKNSTPSLGDELAKLRRHRDRRWMRYADLVALCGPALSDALERIGASKTIAIVNKHLSRAAREKRRWVKPASLRRALAPLRAAAKKPTPAKPKQAKLDFEAGAKTEPENATH